MGEMEPDSNKPYNIDYYEYRIRECLLNPSETISRTDSWHSTYKLGEHHVVPEVPQVNQQTDADDETQNEHVL
jgi:hypothetical protein